MRARSVVERLGRGDRADFARAAAEAFDPDVLTVGFARRVATYKRLGLLVADIDAARELLGAPHPIQLVLAGKAHPSDEDGKRLLTDLFELKPTPEVAGSVVYLEDYDLATAALLVRGADVWLNLPRPPLEASGTSGMKAAINGGLHLSVLDGWWAEAYDGSNGWALSGEVDDDTEAQDARDGAELRRLLSEEVVPLFYERGADGIPEGWTAKMRASLRSIGPAFSAQRMLRDYMVQEYDVLRAFAWLRSADGRALSRLGRRAGAVPRAALVSYHVFASPARGEAPDCSTAAPLGGSACGTHGRAARASRPRRRARLRARRRRDIR